MNIRSFCWAGIFLFGTFLHEFSHFIAALLVGRPKGFSLLPRRVGAALILGEVKSEVRYKVLGLFVAAAPLIWWALIFLARDRLMYALYLSDFRRTTIAELPEKLKALGLRDILSLWIVFQLIWAGRLSIQDIRTCIRGILSPSGVVFFAVFIVSVKFFRYIGH